MSDPSKALLIDIGNTQIKYTLVNEISDLTKVRYCKHPEDLTPYIGLVEKVLVSSVGHMSLLIELERLC